MARALPNILVVEDDRETRTLIAKYLRSNACNVTTAADGREMVRAMTDHRVDLVILDVIRRKIESDPHDAAMIKTVRSGGYMFTPRVDAVTIPANG